MFNPNERGLNRKAFADSLRGQVASMSRSRIEGTIRKNLGACEGALAAALSEVEASLTLSGYLEGILRELPGMDPEAAVVWWALRRGRVWRPAGRGDCRARAEG